MSNNNKYINKEDGPRMSSVRWHRRVLLFDEDRSRCNGGHCQNTCSRSDPDLYRCRQPIRTVLFWCLVKTIKRYEMITGKQNSQIYHYTTVRDGWFWCSLTLRINRINVWRRVYQCPFQKRSNMKNRENAERYSNWRSQENHGRFRKKWSQQ